MALTGKEFVKKVEEIIEPKLNPFSRFMKWMDQ